LPTFGPLYALCRIGQRVTLDALIAIVDDHADAANYLARLLKSAGYGVAAYTCGQQFFEGSETPSLIIMDVQMPDRDGIECLRQIRAAEPWQRVPVIMYSGDFDFARMQEAKRLGAQEYVVKGTTQWQDFLDMIQRYDGVQIGA
jgi:PleD family two-component response regulator